MGATLCPPPPGGRWLVGPPPAGLTIPGGGPLRPPFRFFCAVAKRLKIFSSYDLVTFPYYSLRTFQKKMAGQVRSGQVRSPERVC